MSLTFFLPCVRSLVDRASCFHRRSWVRVLDCYFVTLNALHICFKWKSSQLLVKNKFVYSKFYVYLFFSQTMARRTPQYPNKIMLFWTITRHFSNTNLRRLTVAVLWPTFELMPEESGLVTSRSMQYRFVAEFCCRLSYPFGKKCGTKIYDEQNTPVNHKVVDKVIITSLNVSVQTFRQDVDRQRHNKHGHAFPPVDCTR